MTTACLGVCCEKHKDCQLYHAVEFYGPAVDTRIGTCGPTRPLFMAVEPSNPKPKEAV